ncbi:diacylglycerol/lipid kinase family protein [Caproicibacter sp. BJN0012]|uniref:diacylglycerol/lipid kinase family protein n=1 Tax=Acutalibacteraceae TaxID=3082771 RepID=UPI0013E8BFD3|nr:diacylglycerol kinase family protein [Caproicibacter sp. BJN0012]
MTKLIFNPYSGNRKQSAEQLMEVESGLQQSGSLFETYFTEPDGNLGEMIHDAFIRGIRRFTVCGGDGTVSSVARELNGYGAILNIIPKGTQNNIAYSLKIPFDLDSAMRLSNSGQAETVDIGLLTSGKKYFSFLEVCSIGLISSVFSSADAIQHGNFLRISDFISKLAKTKPAQFHMLVDDKYQLNGTAYCIVVSSMPYIFRHYEVGPAHAYRDGLLDVSVFTDMTKLDLAGCAIKINSLEDERIQRFCSKKIELDTFPDLPVMADGVDLDLGHIKIEAQRSSFQVITGYK